MVVIAHKAVSKAEGATVALSDVQPGARARELAAEQDRDARVVQVVLEQSSELLRAEHGVLICRTAHGFVCANAGVDASNALERGHAGPASPRPRCLGAADPRAPAGVDGRGARRADHRQLRSRLAPRPARRDDRPRRHAAARGLAWAHRCRRASSSRATWLAVADAAAAAADLARAKDSREPVVIIDGLERFVTAADGPGAAALLRPLEEDLFR